MPGPSVQHLSFSIERVLNASQAQVFMAWSNPSVKRRWFVGPRGQWKERIREFDFRVGGRRRGDHKVNGELFAGEGDRRHGRSSRRGRHDADGRDGSGGRAGACMARAPDFSSPAGAQA